MKKSNKIILLIISLYFTHVLLTFLFLICFVGLPKPIITRFTITYNEEYHDKISNNIKLNFFPTASSLENCEKFKYSYKKINYGVLLKSYSKGHTLFVKYDYEDYMVEKNKIYSSYDLLNEIYFYNEDISNRIDFSNFKFNNFTIYFYSTDGNNIVFGKYKNSFGMIGFDDDRKIISYFYCEYIDMDDIFNKSNSEFEIYLNSDYRIIFQHYFYYVFYLDSKFGD